MPDIASLPPTGLRDALNLLQKLLDGETLTVASAVTHTGVQRAAVRRWLRCMAETIRGVHHDDGSPERFWWVSPAAEQTQPSAVWSLAAARTMLHAFREAMIGTVLKDLHLDLISRLPPRDRQADFSRMFFANTRLVNPPRANPEVVDKIAKAIFDSVEVALTYTNFQGDVFDEQIQPWSILFSNDGIYCLGLCVDSNRDGHLQQRRLYSIARISKISLTKRPFTYPLREEYDPVEQFKHCFGIFLPPESWTTPDKVVIRFAPSYRYYLEQQPIHRAQFASDLLADGWTEVRAHLYVSYDLVCWVRGLGLEARPVGPPLLVEWVSSGEGAGFWKAFESRAG